MDCSALERHLEVNEKNFVERVRVPAIVAGLVIVAAWLRLPTLLHAGLWRDEAFVYFDVAAPSFAEFLRRVSETEYHPPLYFLLALGWTRVFGTGEPAMTVLPYLCSIVTVCVLFRLGKAGSSNRYGLASAAAFAVSPLAVELSTSYLYPFATLIFSALALCVVEARRLGATPRSLAAVTVFAALAVYTHYIALFFVPALVVWVLLAGKFARASVAIAAALLLGMTTFLAWAPVFLHQHHVGLPYWHAASSPQVRAAFAISVLFACLPVFSALGERIVADVLIVGFVLYSRKNLNATACGLGAVFLAVLFCVSAANLLEIRYILPAYGLFCVFLAWILVSAFEGFAVEAPRLWKPYGVTIAAILVLALLQTDVAYAIRTARLPNSGIRPYLTAHPADSETLYVVAPDFTAATFAFYSRGTNVTVRGFVRDDRPEIFRLDGYQKLWADPKAVALAATAIERQAKKFRYLDFVTVEGVQDSAAMRYAKTWELLHGLESRYHLQDRTVYPARREPIVVYHFRLDRPALVKAAE